MTRQSDENWSAGFFQNLSSLSSDRTNADVTLWIGNRPLSAHKFVLDTNSSIMKIEDVYFKTTEKKYHVTMPAEFDEKFELVSKLITSFYTGVIEIGDDDANFVHKFANLFDIKWLKIKTLAIYKRTLNKKSFVQIFQYSHSICCKDLIGLCLDFLSEDVFDFLLDTGELLKINYFCVMSICEAKFAFVPEIKKFRFVCKWFETDVRSRICHIESIIPLIGYNTLVNSEVTLVFNWILENKHIDEDRRINLMKNVNKRKNDPIDEATINLREHKSLQICERNLHRIKESLLDDKQPPTDSSVSFEEFYLIVKNFFLAGDSLTKHLLVEFYTKNFGKFLTDKTITDLIRLSTWDFPIYPIVDLLDFDDSKKFLRVISKMEWKGASLKNLQAFVRNTIEMFHDSRRILYKLRIIESILNWVLEHSHNSAQVWDLMNETLCLCDFPAIYLENLLKPHILLVSSQKEVSHQCPQHKWKTVFKVGTPVAKEDTRVNIGGEIVSRWDCFARKLPKEIYMMKKCSFDFYVDYETYRLNFQSKNKESLFTIKMIHSTMPVYLNPMFILYAENQCMESYPVLSPWNMPINQFREFVAKYDNLSFMVIDSCRFFERNLDLSLHPSLIEHGNTSGQGNFATFATYIDED